MAKRPKLLVADGEGGLIELQELLRQRQECADKIKPAKEPETPHEAMLDVALSRRWGLQPRDKSHAILLEQYGREVMPILRRNKKASGKRAQWQAWANEYFARHPEAKKAEAAAWMKRKHAIAETPEYIAKRISKK